MPLLTDEAYKARFDDILHAFRLLVMTGPDETTARAMAATVERADSLGFALDPAARYMALRSGSIDRQRAVLALYLHVKQELAGLFTDATTLDGAMAEILGTRELEFDATT